MSTLNDIAHGLELLRGKWTIQILIVMQYRPVRLSELKRAMPAASKKALVASLRTLETEKLVIRRDLSSSVLHVEYGLADGLRNPLMALLKSLSELNTWRLSTPLVFGGSDKVCCETEKRSR